MSLQSHTIGCVYKTPFCKSSHIYISVLIVTMDAFILRIAYIICIIVMVSPGSLCEECGSSMDDDQLYDYNDSVMVPLESYCFVNECTIRIEESNVLLNVINNTGDWVIATNATSLFMIFVNDSINNDCASNTTARLYELNTAFYAIRMIMYCIAIIAVVTNVSMHLIFRELCTVSGILVIVLCISIGIALLSGAIRIAGYYHQFHIPTEVCAIFTIYLAVVSINIYGTSKTAILVHFVHTMYRGYKLLSGELNKRSLLCKYITFVFGASTVSSGIIITLDAIVYRIAFDAENGQCNYIFNTSDDKEIHLSSLNTIFFVILPIWLLMQVALATVGLVLYFLTTKQCCAASTSRDIRVSFILIAVVDLNTIIFVLLLFTHISALISSAIMQAIVAVEQVALFILFASSSKVMCCSMKERNNHSDINA